MLAAARLVLAMATRMTFLRRGETKFQGNEGSLWRGSNGFLEQALKPTAEFCARSDLRMIIGSAFGSAGDDAGGGPTAQWPPMEAQRRYTEICHRGPDHLKDRTKARADPTVALQAGPAIPIRISPSCGSAWSHSGQDARAVPRRGRSRHREHESHALNPLAAS